MTKFSKHGLPSVLKCMGSKVETYISEKPKPK
jgi:hypothetical protein